MKPTLKNSRFVVLFLSLCFAGSILIISCIDLENAAEPGSDVKLIIDNGYYTKVETGNVYENIYSVVVQYHAEGSDFLIGDYEINWKSGDYSRQVFYNSMIVDSEKSIRIEDTFKYTKEVTDDPIITITGYALNHKNNGIVSEASYVIQRK